MRNSRQNVLWLYILTFAITVSGCTQSPIRKAYVPIKDAFVVHQPSACSQICWLHIEPSITSVNSALDILNTSELVVKNSIKRSEHRIYVDWYTDESKALISDVELNISDDTVQSIAFGQLIAFTVNDIFDLAGQPDEIIIDAWEGVHGEKFTSYTLFFNQTNLVIQVALGNEHGPAPTDTIINASINTHFEFTGLRWKWEGFDVGYFQETPIPP